MQPGARLRREQRRITLRRQREQRAPHPRRALLSPVHLGWQRRQTNLLVALLPGARQTGHQLVPVLPPPQQVAPRRDRPLVQLLVLLLQLVAPRRDRPLVLLLVLLLPLAAHQTAHRRDWAARVHHQTGQRLQVLPQVARRRDPLRTPLENHSASAYFRGTP